MRKKSYLPTILLLVLAVVCLLIGCGVISFGAGAAGFMAKQRPAFIVDAILALVAAVVMAMLASGKLTDMVELDWGLTALKDWSNPPRATK